MNVHYQMSQFFDWGGTEAARFMNGHRIKAPVNQPTWVMKMHVTLTEGAEETFTCVSDSIDKEIPQWQIKPTP